jgi:hypothetical protein
MIFPAVVGCFGHGRDVAFATARLRKLFPGRFGFRQAFFSIVLRPGMDIRQIR